MWNQFEQLFYSDDNAGEFANKLVNGGSTMFKYNPDKMDRRTMRNLSKESDELLETGIANVIVGVVMIMASIISSQAVANARSNLKKH